MSQVFTDLDSDTSVSILWDQSKDNFAAVKTRFSGATAPVASATFALAAGMQYWPTGAGGIVQDYNGSSWDNIYLKGVRADDNDAQSTFLSVSASFNAYVLTVKRACTVAAVKATSRTTTVSNGTDHWTVQIRNLTASLNLRSASFDTNGNEFTAHLLKDLGVDQNLNLAAGDMIELQVTKNGAATTMAELRVLVDALPR